MNLDKNMKRYLDASIDRLNVEIQAKKNSIGDLLIDRCDNTIALNIGNQSCHLAHLIGQRDALEDLRKYFADYFE